MGSFVGAREDFVLGYLVHLQKFEGPLGLLLYLIRKEEMDIFDINVHEITRQYLDYIRMMKELDLEIAGDFVAMAATLIHIKSRMLLPQYSDDGEIVEKDDPRKELVQKLLDYQRYQESGKRLYERPLLSRDLWPSAIEFEWKDDSPGAVITEDEGLFSLIGAYRKTMRRVKTAVHIVHSKVQSISERVMEIKEKLIVGARITLRDLLTAHGPELRVQTLVTFLSLLELSRMGFVNLFQSETYGDIHVEATRTIERNVLERVQEFEGEDAEQVANSIFDHAFDEGSEVKIETMAAMATDEELLAAEAEVDAEVGLGLGLEDEVGVIADAGDIEAPYRSDLIGNG